MPPLLRELVRGLARDAVERVLGLRAELVLFLAVLFLAVLFLLVPAALRAPLVAALRVPLPAALRVVLVLRLLVLRLRVPVLLRAPLLARLADPAELARAALDRPLEVPASSSDHLPDITRCAASATASAISVPSRLALDMTLVAACEAESAASRPASRILRRAAGLALIAAAAAASPAPSISRLIAALAILSTVVLLEREDELLLFFLLDFAIAQPPVDGRKTLQADNSSRCPTMQRIYRVDKSRRCTQVFAR